MSTMSRPTILVRLFLIFLIVQLASCEWKPNNRKKEALCKTPECKTRGDEYKNNMDTRTNPCQDFYTFTCGNWDKNHPGPKYISEYNVIHLLNSYMFNIIRHIFESYNFSPTDNSLFHLAKDVYETCLKIPAYPIKEAKEIAREIVRVGRLSPTNSLWDIHTNYVQLSGESAFFRVKILAHRPSEGIPVLMLMEPTSAFGSIYHELAWKPQERENYMEFLFLIMKSLKLTGSDTLIKDRIQKVFDFRRNLDMIIERNSRNRPDHFDPLTVQELDMWFFNTLHDKTKTQDIPWLKVTEAFLQNVPWQIRQFRKVVAMRQSKYFVDLMNLLKNIPEEVLVSHIEMYFVERHLKLNDNMIKLLQATSVEPHTLLTYIREKHYPRWHICIENHNMKDTLEQMLFKNWFQWEQHGTIHHLIGRLKTAINNQMRNSNWLDQPTRVDTMRRLNTMEEWIGFPAWFTSYALPKERKKTDILTPNASLNNKYNLLYVHAPLLLPPIFSLTIPPVYNYAGIGTTLGHEMYHTIDDCGRYQDKHGKIIWWSDEMRSKCLGKKLVFIEAYNNITNREFQNRYNLHVKSDTSISFSENFPDVMGLTAAYDAYKELASTDQSACQVLPGFKDYTCDQMFYIAFGNTYCGHYTPKAAQEKLEKSVHSIDSVRINGAIAQMQSFANAFGCPAGSPMNPENKVNLWQ